VGVLGGYCRGPRLTTNASDGEWGALEKQDWAKIGKKICGEVLSAVLGSLCQAAHVFCSCRRKKVNSGQGMCYQWGISLNRETLFAGKPRWKPYAAFIVHRVEKCGSYAGQVISMLLLNKE
jgi:hypothetical protein